MKKVALIVAGGDGERMKSKIPKQFLKIKNFPVLMHTIKRFSHFEKIILVLPKNQLNYWKNLCKKHNFNKEHIVVKGGKNRFESVKNGLKKITTLSIVSIHDGVRPLVSTNLINSLISKTKQGVGVIPVIPIKNSIRKIKKNTSKNIDRKNLFIVQTPQCFLSADIKKAYNQEFKETFTDDASVFENNGWKIISILGEESNIKITTKNDFKIVQLLMQ